MSCRHARLKRLKGNRLTFTKLLEVPAGPLNTRGFRLSSIQVQIAVVLVAVALLLGGSIGQAQERDEANHAGLVIRDQAGALTYAYVAFSEPEISGLELLERSGVPVVTVGFGGLGEGVCAIGGQGCSVNECRRRLCQGPRADDPFWQAFRQHAPGDWRPLLLGASSTMVKDGDVNGWSWTGSAANLPAVTMEEIAHRAGPPGAAAVADGPIEIDWRAYAGAAVILAAIGGGALVLSRRAPRHAL
jgi:hypothetical protein